MLRILLPRSRRRPRGGHPAPRDHDGAVSVMRLIRMHHGRAFPLVLITIATTAAAACGSSGSKPAPQAAPTQPTATQPVTTKPPPAPPQKFTSQRFSFHVTLTKDWSGTDAVVASNGNKLQGLGSAPFANFADPAAVRTLVAAAARVTTG